jgi:hypothetical protein
MWIIVFAALLIGGLILNEVIRHALPRTYVALEVISWTIEGLLVVGVVVGLIYQYVTGHLP